MGHPPLIPDNSFTTRLPAEVDEDAFRPSSTVLPAPSENVDGPNKSSAYFVLKCRCVNRARIRMLMADSMLGSPNWSRTSRSRRSEIRSVMIPVNCPSTRRRCSRQT